MCITFRMKAAHNWRNDLIGNATSVYILLDGKAQWAEEKEGAVLRAHQEARKWRCSVRRLSCVTPRSEWQYNHAKLVRKIVYEICIVHAEKVVNMRSSQWTSLITQYDRHDRKTWTRWNASKVVQKSQNFSKSDEQHTQPTTVICYIFILCKIAFTTNKCFSLVELILVYIWLGNSYN